MPGGLQDTPSQLQPQHRDKELRTLVYARTLTTMIPCDIVLSLFNSNVYKAVCIYIIMGVSLFSYVWILLQTLYCGLFSLLYNSNYGIHHSISDSIYDIIIV